MKEKGRSRKGNYVQSVKLIMSQGSRQEVGAGSVLITMSEIGQYIEGKKLDRTDIVYITMFTVISPTLRGAHAFSQAQRKQAGRLLSVGKPPAI